MQSSIFPQPLHQNLNPITNYPSPSKDTKAPMEQHVGTVRSRGSLQSKAQQRHVGDAIVVFDESRVVPLFQAGLGKDHATPAVGRRRHANLH